ncbi:dihydrofolate reductase [Actinomadura craniellae]|uniref:Dihydrofolate reductase n=1 Tax=Actinomadura craniellae TaxID=2231787 RepID=A0A365H917_9ACTN|nr:dihydrofolate reductase family protein [Actinomadura craniellae]RAY15529.1 dihydrofolate reductase [Actinomadura craniellae]
MRKIVYFVHVSLDGYIEGPNGEFDWPVMGPELSEYSHELAERAGAFLYGRLVWEMMSGYWPDVESVSDHPHDLRFAPIWRATPKVVVSRTLQEAGWNARVVGRNLAAEITAIKREPGGDLLLTGGTGLADSLTALGLVDEYHVVVHPVLLGGGKPLLPTAKGRVPLELAGSRVLDGRLVLLHHRPAS